MAMTDLYVIVLRISEDEGWGRDGEGEERGMGGAEAETQSRNTDAKI